MVVYRRRDDRLEVLIAHPGGPLFAKKDAGSWTIPKGLVEPSEDLRLAAVRELREETGLEVPPSATLLELGKIRQRSGKEVTAFALELDCDPTTLRSNSFELEWPPRSGRNATYPELDRFMFASVPEASIRMIKEQFTLIERLQEVVGR